MTHLEEIDPEYAHMLRQKMKQWRIPIEDEPMGIMTLGITSDVLSRLGTRLVEAIDVTSEINDLKSRVRELERRAGGKREPTQADYVYELFREELEKKHFGKIVAIDTESKEIVGKGNTILEAYNEAKDKTGKDQFDFKRVGYKYLYKV